MARYQAFDPNTELTGQTALAFIKNINHREIERILKKHGLDRIDPASWYLLQRVLDVLTDISTEINSSSNFVSIGVAAAQLNLDRMPPELRSLPIDQWLQMYCEKVYQERHRNGNAGKLTLTKESPQRLRINMHSPYPDDLMYGVLYSYTRAMRPIGKGFTLRYEDGVPRHDQGGDQTIIHIEIDP
jgi:hypothetical protein